MSKHIDLGFAEDCEMWQVESRLFPSKIGGKPAWLDLEKLPSNEDLQCKKCNQQLIFLCQIYAPYEEDDNNFHRTIFVFICRNSNCCQTNTNDNVKVFRSHLRKENKFYSSEPPDYKPDSEFNLGKFVTLCNICGCYGTKYCSKCKRTIYCTREHQLIDWKENHKNNCSTDVQTRSNLLFKEFELVIEPEEIVEKSTDETEELKKFQKMQIEGKAGTMVDLSDTDLEQHASIDHDKTFNRFKKRISQYPEQILRYERNGKPLWIAETPIPTIIPDCEYCGGPRQFEFQIMPQLLTVLNENDIDWGILCIYTCKASCTLGNKYKMEHVFKQDCSSK